MPSRNVKNQVSPAFWRDARRVVSVRNPYDRMVSEFYHRGWNPKWRRDLSAPALRKRMERFLNSGNLLDDRPIFYVDGELAANRVIRFETLESDLESLAQDAGLDWSQDALPHHKSGYRQNRSHPLRHYYSDESIRLVQDHQSWMFREFGYDRDLDAAEELRTAKTTTHLSANKIAHTPAEEIS